MKTFTVTIHRNLNYGALYQAYSLQHALLSLGVENVLFDYEKDVSPLSSFHWDNLLLSAKYMYGNLIYYIHRGDIERKINGFDEFHREHLILSKKYSSMEELRRDPPDADMLITGSDQVWNIPKNEEFVGARFLDFGGENVKRISYAASGEGLSYSDEQKEYVKEKLSRFDRISLREKENADLIGELTGKDTVRVCDPVFLTSKEEWMKLAKPRKIKKPYILCYQVQNSPYMSRLVKEVKKKTGLCTVSVIPSAKKWIMTDKTLYDVTPEELLSLYDGASAVVTASFHGTAMGLLFGKPTYSTVKPGRGNRIKSLSGLFSVGDFCVCGDGRVPDISEFNAADVLKTVDKERAAALEYIKSCIKEDR